MDPCEAEFLAEKEIITIKPNFTHGVIYLIGGKVGPFRAGMPSEVPLWMALHLRQRQKCKIIPPDWLDAEILTGLKEEEKNNRFFTKMPSEHYMIVANLLLRTAEEDMTNVQEIRTAVKDLWDVRISKLRTSVDSFIKSGGSHARLDYLTVAEINSVRPLLPHALDFLSRLNTAQEATQRSQGSGVFD